MLTYEDCLGLCELSEDEIRAIAQHENLPELVALELGQYLVTTPDGQQAIRRMILDDIDAASASRDAQTLLRLKATLKHFVETHPAHPAKAKAGV